MEAVEGATSTPELHVGEKDSLGPRMVAACQHMGTFSVCPSVPGQEGAVVFVSLGCQCWHLFLACAGVDNCMQVGGEQRVTPSGVLAPPQACVRAGSADSLLLGVVWYMPCLRCQEAQVGVEVLLQPSAGLPSGTS